MREQFINHGVIKRYRLLIDLTVAVGDQPRPGERGAKGVQTNIFSALNIFPIMLIKRRGIIRRDALEKALVKVMRGIIPDIIALDRKSVV